MADPDAPFMRRALRLARRGEGSVEPNPMVGCVLVRDGAVLGEGWHRRFGGPHAEVEALRSAGDAARGATAYVTLEPCSHRGKTPPCTEALIEAGVGRVRIGAMDPTPDRAGEGVRRLEAAGIDVQRGPLSDESARLLEAFARRTLTGLPWVTAKWAATLDGAIATRTGDSRWISNERSRRLVHRVRGRVDAVLTGIGTALADDPRLTARTVRPRRIARRVVLDPRLQLPADSRLIATLGEAPLTVATAEATLRSEASAPHRRALEAAGAELLPLPTREADGALDLAPLLRHLVRTHDATNVLVEAGGRTVGTLLEQDLLQELMVFLAPKLLGDPQHIGPLALPEAALPVPRIDRARPVELRSTRRLGDDLLLRYRVPDRL